MMRGFPISAAHENNPCALRKLDLHINAIIVPTSFLKTCEHLFETYVHVHVESLCGREITAIGIARHAVSITATGTALCVCVSGL